MNCADHCDDSENKHACANTFVCTPRMNTHDSHVLDNAMHEPTVMRQKGGLGVFYENGMRGADLSHCLVQVEILRHS